MLVFGLSWPALSTPLDGALVSPAGVSLLSTAKLSDVGAAAHVEAQPFRPA